jgi:hypothetical protein
MVQTLAELNCKEIQSTSDEAPGLLAYVEHHLGAHHMPDLCHVQHELSRAVSAPIAVKQRTAAKAMQTAEETLKRAQEYLDAPAKSSSSRSLKGAVSREQGKPSLSSSRGMRGSRCVNWTCRRPHPTPCTPI